jgi:two-component system, NarL family, nitrate/nitrite response regulator NarL
MDCVSVALIDDQPLIIEGFKSLFSRTNGIKLVATANFTAAAAEVVKTHAPHLIYVEVASPENNLDDLTSLMKVAPEVKIVALTASRSMKLAIKTLNAGAHGYILKQSSLEEIAHATRTIVRGEKYVTHCVANQLIAALHDVAARNAANRQIKFSMREDQILRLLLDGKTNKAIAGILAITENTVKHYMSILMQKLNARNRLEVVIAAQKLEQNSTSGERVH